MNTPSPPPRVRFAPSPTGVLHVGGARTALFNFLFARHHAGAFLLRIEDTDRARSSPEMTEQILSALDWLGLEVDEPPVHQGDGIDRHLEAAERLLASGAAYRSFLDADELAGAREAARAEGVPMRRDRLGAGDGDGVDGGGVDGAAGDRAAAAGAADDAAAADAPHAVFFAVPDSGATEWDDAVHGRTGVRNDSIDDFVILRSDGTPVYNLAVVADDIEMRVTHVIRGDDHLSNTPKQALIYQALGAAPPVFCHVPMILGPDGKRLSKRHGAASVEAFRDEGILPEALVNFLALLGWSPGDDREVMTLDELIEAFSLDRILKKAAVFDAEKLKWLNGRHLAAMPAGRLTPLLLEHLPDPERTAAAAEPDRLLAAADLVRRRTRTVEAMAEQSRSFFTPLDGFAFDDDATAKHWKDAGQTTERLRAARELIATAEDFRPEPLEASLRALAERLGIGAGKLFQPLRVGLVGTDRSPGISDTIVALGRDRAVARLDRALAELATRHDAAGA